MTNLSIIGWTLLCTVCQYRKSGVLSTWGKGEKIRTEGRGLRTEGRARDKGERLVCSLGWLGWFFPSAFWLLAPGSWLLLFIERWTLSVGRWTFNLLPFSFQLTSLPAQQLISFFPFTRPLDPFHSISFFGFFIQNLKFKIALQPLPFPRLLGPCPICPFPS